VKKKKKLATEITEGTERKTRGENLLGSANPTEEAVDQTAHVRVVVR
jgi:hypothetical protein